MELENLRAVLGWSTLIGWGLLLIWWGMVVLASDWMFGFHGHWFGLSRNAFDIIHYCGMGLLKLGILLLFLIPYLSLRLVGD